MTENVVALRPTRLPMPADAGVDAGQWRVLVEAIFPSARSADSIMLALDYCKARGLDVMKKPVNIVPMWNSQLGRYVETVWPSINEIQVTAARTKEWAGMDPPEWGPNATRVFKGRRKEKNGWVDATVEVTFPEFCSVTVYRMIDSTRCAFTEPVYWTESYGRVGGSELPNDMWAKRPRGQLHKVAKAASLRAAFPEEGERTAEEMDGATLDPPTEPAPSLPAPADNWQPPQEPPREEPPPDDFDPDTGEVGPRALARGADEEWREWCQRLLGHIRMTTTLDEIDKWVTANTETLAALKDGAPKIHVQLTAAIGRQRVSLAQQEAPKDGAPTDASTDG